MSAFYKLQQGQNEFYFQFINSLEAREDFALWDNTSKKFIRHVNNINDIKFMKADVFVQRYPSMRKVTQYVRDIAVTDGNTFTQYQFGFRMTVEQQIKQFIANCNALKVNPMEVLLKYRKIGSGLNTQHTITAMETIGLPQNVIQPQIQAIPQQLIQSPIQPQIMPDLSPVKPTEALQQGFTLPKVNVAREPTTNEMHVIQWANDYKDKLTEEQFVEGFNHSLKKNFGTMTEETLVREWFKKYYLK